jgi:dTDP-4-amino-4,6-dideoxygalactose transaminase
LVDILPSGQMNFDHLNQIRKVHCVDAVIVVHLCGSATFIPEMDIPVIEDSCQSVGSEIDGRKTGSVGNISAFSYYPGKNLGALGDGGAITTSDVELDRFCRMLRNHGCETKYKHDLVGYTARLDNLQAMFLNTKLPNLDAENEQRRQVASYYYEQLLTSSVRNHFEFQTKNTSERNNFHLFVVKTPRRDGLAKFLNDNGIETGLHYPEPLHKMKANENKYLNVEDNFPESERWAKECLSLPMHPNMKFEEVSFVCQKIKEFFK